MNPLNRLVELALSYEGVREVGGANRGPEVEQFQKAVDGKAWGEPWCMAFVQFCVKKVCKEIGFSEVLPNTESCVELWKKVDPFLKLEKPMVGCLVIWENYHQGEPTGKGHVGIVVEVLNDNLIETIEGNTGPDSKTINREGDGVYKKTRFSYSFGKMRVLGFVAPFPTPTWTNQRLM